MLYLSGVKNPEVAADMATGRMGLLQTPGARYNLNNVAVWALDNGCYTNKYPGDEAYLRLLNYWGEHQPRCLFVAVPDVVGDGVATLEMFPTMAARIRSAGWPVALVGQDGMEHMTLPWDDMDWLFIGGSTDWKLGRPGAAALIRQAQERGKSVHVGRVNSARRFRRFATLGCDTADGTHIAFLPRARAMQVRGWMHTASEPTLF